MKLQLEQLGERVLPAVVPGFRPNFPAADGMQLRDIEQSSYANDCSFLASLGAAITSGVDLSSRISKTGRYTYSVDLTGRPDVPVFFNGNTVPKDPACEGDDFWVLLFARAHRKTHPEAAGGESVDIALYEVLGSWPGYDDSPQKLGWQELQGRLREGDAAIAANWSHAVTAVSVEVNGKGIPTVTVYNPWGMFQRMTWGRFVRKYGELAVADSEVRL
jgi:hypothetical protein